MPRQYPTGFRDEMVGRMLAGESVSDLVLIRSFVILGPSFAG